MKTLVWSALVGDEIHRWSGMPPTRKQLSGRVLKVMALQDGDRIRAMVVHTETSNHISIEDQKNLLSGEPSTIRCKVRVRETPGAARQIIQQIIECDLATVIYDCQADQVHIQVKGKKE